MQLVVVWPVSADVPQRCHCVPSHCLAISLPRLAYAVDLNDLADLAEQSSSRKRGLRRRESVDNATYESGGPNAEDLAGLPTLALLPRKCLADRSCMTGQTSDGRIGVAPASHKRCSQRQNTTRRRGSSTWKTRSRMARAAG